jgi:hypothetical protein
LLNREQLFAARHEVHESKDALQSCMGCTVTTDKQQPQADVPVIMQS